MPSIQKSIISGLLGVDFGDKVTVPEFPGVNTGQVEADTMASAGAANQFTLEQLQKSLEFLSPGSSKKLGSTIASQLSGELAPEDTSAVIRNATAAGFKGGFGGKSGIGRNLVGRDLGLSVQGIKQQGMANLAAYQKMASDPTSLFLSASQRFAGASAGAENQFKRQLLVNQISAGMDPWSAETVKIAQSL